MGKIFDALEKANKKAGIDSKRSLPTKKSNRQARKKETVKSNVVPFVNPQPYVDGDGVDQDLIALHSPHSVEAEIFKTLRTNLLFPSKGDPPKSIMVTSALPNDGKSFVAANLAISIALGVEEHVLLIDADVRNSRIDTLFGVSKASGLSDYLAKGEDVSKNFVKTMVDKLTVLPAGQSPKNPTELLTTQKMKGMLEEVTARYDDRYIIIDTAPPSLTPETAAIANFVDGIIIVVKSGKTPQKQIKDSIELLDREKILGVVLNYSDHSANKYYSFGKPYLSER